MSDRLLDQRMNIKFCATLGKRESETQEILTVSSGADARKISRIRVGREDMKDDERIGRSKAHRTVEKKVEIGSS